MGLELYGKSEKHTEQIEALKKSEQITIMS